MRPAVPRAVAEEAAKSEEAAVAVPAVGAGAVLEGAEAVALSERARGERDSIRARRRACVRPARCEER